MSKLEGKKRFTATIAGEEYVLEPSFKAIAAIEGALGKTIFEVTQDSFKQGIGVTTVILFHAIRSNKDNNARNLTVDTVGQAVVADFGSNERELMTTALTFLNEYYPKDADKTEKKTEAQQ